MFTGIVEDRGVVRHVRPEGTGIGLVLDVPPPLAGGCRVGGSVAVNGCCLTVVDMDGNGWAFQAGAETLSKTNLGELRPQDWVNLERALPADGRFGGHFVQGHVDGTGRVQSVRRQGAWAELWVSVPEVLAAQLVPKGSVAVDGVSLTLVNVARDRFSVALIPHTLDITTLGVRREGDAVNIETDILGKYVQKFLSEAGWGRRTETVER